jgi:polyhydroxybutyrate depolymerase
VSAGRPLGAILVAATLFVGTACAPSADEDAVENEASDTVDRETSPSTPALVPATDPVGSITHRELRVDGRERTYRLYVPDSLPERPVPLFIGLHGGTGWGDQFATTNHVEGLAEANDFLVVHPDGVSIGAGPGSVWNGGVCCGVAAREQVDDVAFVAAVLDEIEARFDVDADQVFAFGHSNGGIMSYRLACELSDRIVGIGVVAGTVGVGTCTPSEPVSVMHVHGTADQNLPIGGGQGERSIAGVDFPSPMVGFDDLVAEQHCPEPVESVDGDVTVALWEPCASGAAMTFVTIESGPHAWPGGTPRIAPPSGEGVADYDATAALVSFLLDHPRR